jgi:outer membrane protein assembly factor BamE (lipoprotein component of BamABCDE complex)
VSNPFEDLDSPSPREPKKKSRKDAQQAAARKFILTTFGAMGVVAVLSCGFCAIYQLIMGGPMISAIGSRRITEKEFDRVKGGMTQKQVTDILGPPARTGYRGGQLNWYWYKKDGRASFSIDFDDQDRVRDRGMFTPD